MAIREKHGKLEYRFVVDKIPYRSATGLEDTKLNRIKAAALEQKARDLVLEGRGQEVKIISQPFSNGVGEFLEWCKGKYKGETGSYKRRRTSMSVLSAFFKSEPISSIHGGKIENFMTHRRVTDQVVEATLQSDIIALGMYLDFSIKQRWCKVNATAEIKLPSGADSQRMHVLTAEEEKRWFEILDSEMRTCRSDKVHSLMAITDVSKVMLAQGCRPSELLELDSTNVDMFGDKFSIVKSKTKAGIRTLRLMPDSKVVFARRLGSQLVFPGFRGNGTNGLSLRAIDKIVKEIQVKHGIPVEERVVLYDMRHTFATRAANVIKLPKLAAILGHANLKSIQKYIHMKQHDMDAGMDELIAHNYPNFGPISGQLGRDIRQN